MSIATLILLQQFSRLGVEISKVKSLKQEVESILFKIMKVFQKKVQVIETLIFLVIERFKRPSGVRLG